MTTPNQAFAVINGSLCRLGRFGGRVVWHRPLASAIVEFRRGPFRTYVREHTHGLLPGLPNLYCLNGAHRLMWMADWPDADDPCASILDERDGVLVTESFSGAVVRLDAFTGRLLSYEQRLQAVG